jgi:hypothetical protein
MRDYATTLPPTRDTRNIMKKASTHLLILATVAAGLYCAGCEGTLGTDSVNISGSVLTGGKVIGGSLTVNSNTISVGGSVASGGTTNGGTISFPTPN